MFDHIALGVEHQLDERAVTAVSNHILRYFAAEGRLDGADQDRLTGAGLPGQDIQMTGKVNIRFLNQCKILYM